MKEKSVGVNATLNVLKTAGSLLIPLVIFPYISRVLQVEGLGKINFARSVISYFVLFATLGLNTYGIREGASLRNNRVKFQVFFSQVLTITTITTALSLVLLYSMIFAVDRFSRYRTSMLILSISVVLPTIGCEWVCAAYEDYGYITIRTILVQLVSLALIFLLVRSPEDINRYAFILVFSSQGANIFNFFYIQRYVQFTLTKKVDIRLHLRPMGILLASSLATTIFVSSDTTILGLLTDEYYTGLYSAASKLYTVVKSVISSIIIVTIPRFSYYFSNDRHSDFEALLNQICKVVLLLAIPASVGVFILSEDIIVVLSGETFMEAGSALRILSIAILFIAASWIEAQCVLIPMKKEKWVLRVTVVAAILNVMLNLLLVKRWKHNAAAFTTVISEAAVAIAYALIIKKKVRLCGVSRQFIHAVIASGGMAIYLLAARAWETGALLNLFLKITVGIVVYYAVLLVMDDELTKQLTKEVLHRFMKKISSK